MALEDMLLNARTLSLLSLGWNHLSPRGAAALATGIESNISLATLLVRPPPPLPPQYTVHASSTPADLSSPHPLPLSWILLSCAGCIGLTVPLLRLLSRSCQMLCLSCAAGTVTTAYVCGCWARV